MASQRLNLSQPTVSERLARLEHTLGMQLFHRLPRGMTPTATAEYILRQEPDLNQRMQAITRQVQTDGRSRCRSPAIRGWAHHY